MGASLADQRDYGVAALEGAEHDGQHGGGDAVAQDGVVLLGVGAGEFDGHCLGAAKEVGVEGELVLQGGQVFGVEGEGANEACHVVD